MIQEMNRKILYVSDLDGTLLRSDETTSDYTNEIINRMTEQGVLFSYATARSIYTSKKVTKGLNAKIPLIVYNGTFIIDNQTGKRLSENCFDIDVYELLRELFAAGVYPIVYSLREGEEKFSYLERKCSKGMLEFLKTRNDARKHPVDTEEELMEGSLFYITCIDEPERLLPFYEKYKDKFYSVYQKDIYSSEQWLEFMPNNTTKASAITRLKEMLGCDYVVVFGDGRNDIKMFELADESYAVENAVPELKEIATGIIGSNDADGVARWLEKHVVWKR